MNINEERRLRGIVNEEVRMQLNENPLALLAIGPLFNVGEKVYDYFSNKEKKSNPSDARWIVNTAEDIRKDIRECVYAGVLSPHVASMADRGMQSVIHTLYRSGVYRYDPKAANIDGWRLADPTGGLIYGTVKGIDRASKGGALF